MQTNQKANQHMIYRQKDKLTQIVLIPKLYVIQNEFKNPQKQRKINRKRDVMSKLNLKMIMNFFPLDLVFVSPRTREERRAVAPLQRRQLLQRLGQQRPQGRGFKCRY